MAPLPVTVSTHSVMLHTDTCNVQTESNVMSACYSELHIHLLNKSLMVAMNLKEAMSNSHYT